VTVVENVHMYENGKKIIPVETISGMSGGE
jgi:hypothetical protein